MIRIDMTEEPENEDDFIFKAQNIETEEGISYRIPVQDNSGSTSYVDRNFYEYLLDNVINI